MPRWKKILILVLILVVSGGAIAGLLYLRWYNSDERVALRAIKSGDYDKAIEVLDGDFDSKGGEELLHSLQDEIAAAKEDFLAQTCSYQAAKEQISKLRTYGIEELRGDLDAADQYIDRLNSFRTAFETAQKYYAAESYELAMDAYRKVISEDPNYPQAQAELEASAENYREKKLAAKDYDGAIATVNNALKVAEKRPEAA